MSTFKYLLTAAAVLCRLSQTSACSCLPPGTLCDSILSTEIVLHVTALERVEGANINDDVVYTLETIQVFKGEEPGPNEYDQVGGTFEMSTGGNSALCGIFMRTDGTEYLVGMGRRDDVLYAVGICGLIREWREEDRATLEEGCDDYDPCDGECGEFQECARSYDYYAEDSYYCQDTCDPSPCSEGEECTLEYPVCSEGTCVAEASCGEAQSPAPSSTPGGTLLPGGFDSVWTLPPGATIDSTTLTSYVETLAPSGDSRGPPTKDDGRDAEPTYTPAPATVGSPNSPPTYPPAPGRVGPPSSSPLMETPSPVRDERDRDRSESPTATTSPTAPGTDDSRGVSIPTTAAPSPATASDAGDASPLPEVSSAPTVSANAEGDDSSAAQAVRSSGGFVAAMTAVVATAAASCSSL
eukprot:g10079.t1